MGIKTVLTHPDWACTTIPVEIQKSWLIWGDREKLWFDVGLNHSYGNLHGTDDTGSWRGKLPSGDRPRTENFEYPVEALMMFMDAMLDEGFSKEEVRIMTHDVPAFWLYVCGMADERVLF